MSVAKASHAGLALPRHFASTPSSGYWSLSFSSGLSMCPPRLDDAEQYTRSPLERADRSTDGCDRLAAPAVSRRSTHDGVLHGPESGGGSC
jgi:hypothetical protein